jgi:hypothetical protein
MPTSSVKSIERSGTFVLGSRSGKIQVWKDYFGSGSDKLKTKKKAKHFCQLRSTVTNNSGVDLGLSYL